jgi:hypothetical protein
LLDANGAKPLNIKAWGNAPGSLRGVSQAEGLSYSKIIVLFSIDPQTYLVQTLNSYVQKSVILELSVGRFIYRKIVVKVRSFYYNSGFQPEI